VQQIPQRLAAKRGVHVIPPQCFYAVDYAEDYAEAPADCHGRA
jgi:hypothetical protein